MAGRAPPPRRSTFYAGRIFGIANFPYAATLSLITLIVLNRRLDALHDVFTVRL